MPGSPISLITGANTGLGFETSLALAKAGHHVILACRSESKAHQAMAKITRKVAHASLSFIPLDLTDRPSIRACAGQVIAQHDRLDRLINNAGVMGPPYTITQNGEELQFDANHLGHFLLTSLLMPVLKQTEGARIINVSSLAGKRETADIYFDNLTFEGVYDKGPEFLGLPGMGAYQQSKLANLLFTLGLKERLASAGEAIIPLTVHPGASNTDLSRNMKPHLRFLAPILVRFMNVSKPAQGAEALIMAAVVDDVNPGDFFGPTGEEERTGPAGRVHYPPKAFEPGLVDKLWALSENRLGITFDI